MRRFVLAAGLVLTAIGLSSCGSSVAAPPSTTTTTLATTTTSVPGPPCVTQQLAITTSSNSGMGHIGVVLIFTNTAASSCTEVGYPGVAALTSSGVQAVQAIRTLSGYIVAVPDLPTVTLAHGESASAIVEGTDVPSGDATSCPTYPRLLVTPPNATESVTIDETMPGCSPIEVHPVVPGTTGMNQQ
ncbi:MAG: DUF4232 domain-containing protein [Actinomycetota bacterium]